MHVAFPSRRGRCFRNVGDVKGRVLDAALKEAPKIELRCGRGRKVREFGGASRLVHGAILHPLLCMDYPHLYICIYIYIL